MEVLLDFKVLAVDKQTKARCGEIQLANCKIPTPVFMPVGTQGTIKTLTPEYLKETNTKIILCNAYHLRLRPGEKIIKQLGGLHKFMGWDGAIITDSGGYQVFSLTGLIKVSDNGVEFQSPIDGTRLFLTPERMTQIQNDIGADIIMAFDQCVQGTSHRMCQKPRGNAFRGICNRWFKCGRRQFSDERSAGLCGRVFTTGKTSISDGCWVSCGYPGCRRTWN